MCGHSVFLEAHGVEKMIRTILNRPVIAHLDSFGGSSESSNRNFAPVFQGCFKVFSNISDRVCSRYRSRLKSICMGYFWGWVLSALMIG